MKDNYAFPAGPRPGMELRDWFAGLAMQALVTRYGSDLSMQLGAVSAYTVSDALLQVRDMTEEQRDEFLRED